MTPYTNEVDFRRSRPPIEIHRDCIYTPITDRKSWENDHGWGLYDREGRLIEAAAYLRAGHLVGQSRHLDLEHLEIEDAPPGPYLYGGNIIQHFGHFLLSTLSRYWLGLEADLSRYKILCHSAFSPEEWWACTFIQEIFGALGLSVNNFVAFTTPTRINTVIVPRSSAEENTYVHSVYSKWCNRVGRSLIEGWDIKPNPTPIWFSKTKLTLGTQGLVNEADIVSRLSDKGIEIVHPQELTVANQVKLYATRPVIMGAVGSVFHASALWPPKAKLVCVKTYRDVNSNYAIADLSNRNNVSYLDAELRPADRSLDARFTDAIELVNVDDVVDRLLLMAGA